MKLTQGKIIRAELVSSTDRIVTRHFTVATTQTNAEIVLGDEVVVAGFLGFDESALRELRAYLKDRPSLTSDKEVKRGIAALNTLLGTPTEDL